MQINIIKCYKNGYFFWAWKPTSICLYFYSVEQAYVNQRKLETEAKQLQAHAGERQYHFNNVDVNTVNSVIVTTSHKRLPPVNNHFRKNHFSSFKYCFNKLQPLFKPEILLFSVSHKHPPGMITGKPLPKCHRHSGANQGCWEIITVMIYDL